MLPRGWVRGEARAARLLADRAVQAAAPQGQAQRGRSQVAAHSNITSQMRVCIDRAVDKPLRSFRVPGECIIRLSKILKATCQL